MESGGCEEGNMSVTSRGTERQYVEALMNCTSRFIAHVHTYALPPPLTYLMQSQRVAISWRDGVDGGVEGQPALAAEVESTDRKQKGGMITAQRLSEGF